MILPSKPIRASRISLAQMMQPEHANNLGNVHGGWIMKLVDEAGALACMRHAQRRVVTVAINSMIFRHPIKTSDLVILNAEVTYTGRTSIEAEVQVIAENPITGQRWHTNTAYLFTWRWMTRETPRQFHRSLGRQWTKKRKSTKEGDARPDDWNRGSKSWRGLCSLYLHDHLHRVLRVCS